MSDLKNILQQTECLSPKEIKKYLDNNLSKEERFKIESHLNECEFCSEAIEGFELFDSDYVLAGTNEINSKIDNKLNKGFSIQYIIAAASISVVLFFGAIYMLNNSTQKEQLSVKTENAEEKLTEDAIAPKDVKEETVSETISDVDEIENTENEKLSVKPQVLEEKVNENEVSEAESQPTEELDIETDKLVAMEDEAEEEISDPNEEDNSYDDHAHYNFEEPEVIEDLNIVKEQAAGSAVQEPKVAIAYSAQNDDDLFGDAGKDESFINFEKMIALAETNWKVDELEIATTESKTRSKKETNSKYDAAAPSSDIDYKVSNELDLIKNGDYQTALNQINNLLEVNKNDRLTLLWLKAICELKLNLSAKESLKELKRSKNPYQQEAEKIYNKLY